jgi:hypothetical protein
VLGVVAGRSAEEATAALGRAGDAFEAVYVIRVGAGPTGVSAEGVVHVDVSTSREFAALAGDGRWP